MYAKLRPAIAAALQLLCFGSGYVYARRPGKAVACLLCLLAGVLFLRYSGTLFDDFLVILACTLFAAVLALGVQLYSVWDVFRIVRREPPTTGAWKRGALLVGYIAPAVCVGSLLPSQIRISTYVMMNSAMTPTILTGDRLWADRRAYEEASPQVGDIVAARTPQGVTILRRVAAVSGDMVELRSDGVYRNGHREREDITAPSDSESVSLRVPENAVYLLADRGDGPDSRKLGPLSRTGMEKIMYIYWTSDIHRIGRVQ